MAEADILPRIPEQMLRDLERFADTASDSLLDAIIKEIPNVPPASNVADFSRRLAEQLNKNFAEIHPVLYALINLKRVEDETGSAHDLLERITWHIDLADKWDDSLTSKWHSLVPKIEESLSHITPDSNLMISAKFSELAYNRQNILHYSKILTDIRPVFDQAGGAIKGLIVTHSLVIHYSAGLGGDVQEMHLTLDWRDVAALRDECNRADSKAECIKNSMKELPWTTIIYPEPHE